MSTGTSLSLEPEALAAPFLRFDVGDLSDFIELDIVIDLPGIVTVARFHFRSGVGYEVIFTENAEWEDYADVIQVVHHCVIIRCEPWCISAAGYPQMRSLWWEIRKPWLY